MDKQNLINDLGLQDLPEDEKNELVTKLAEALQNRISVRIFDTLSVQEKEELDKLTEAGDEAKINDYLAKSVPNLDFIMRDEYESFKTEILNQNESIKKVIKENLEKS